MAFASIEEVWGDNFCKNKTHKKSKKKKKKKVKEDYFDYSDDLIEQFENFNSQINANSNLENNIYKDQVEITESSPNEEDDDEEDEESTVADFNSNDSVYDRVNNIGLRSRRNNTVPRNNDTPRNNQSLRNNQILKNNKEAENNRMAKDNRIDLINDRSDDSSLQGEIKKMNEKINFILNKMKSMDTIPQLSDNVNKNIYDIILFIVFGLFIILVFESISKLLIKNTDKLVCIPKIKIPTLNE